MSNEDHTDPAAPHSAARGRERHEQTPSERAESADPRTTHVRHADVESEVESLRSDLDAREQQYLRLAADFENFRRRSAQESADRARYASEAAVSALLPVLDNLRRAVEHAESAADGSLLQGVQLTLRQFEEVLAGLGVQPVPTVGEPFDPAVHEAVAGEVSADVDSDRVVAEIQPGYRLHDRLLRPALVKVVHPAGVTGSGD